MARASSIRRKNRVVPTAASECTSRVRKASGNSAFTSSKVALVNKSRSGPKKRASNINKAQSRRIGEVNKVASFDRKTSCKEKPSKQDATVPQGVPGKRIFHQELKSTGLEWEVKKIVDSKINNKGERLYKVQWEHYPAKESTWEPEINLYNCPN